MPSSHPLPAIPALTSGLPSEDTEPLLCKLQVLQPLRPRRSAPGLCGGARLGKGTAQKTLPSIAFTSASAITSTSAITSATITSTPQRALGSRRTQLARPLQGAAQRPRFLCTLERVINLK
ncbi:hypothetical protein HJG60_009720 [Phyllostomus discolor]|uniref:Uncharacterized protein n=1 Tax=Phyllostomus discolor TaxID=89673 RepID=A0A834BCF4_9CHIR|nr:hypothetical protein HJG60_009720 [Phyllostomus discolor]